MGWEMDNDEMSEPPPRGMHPSDTGYSFHSDSRHTGRHRSLQHEPESPEPPQPEPPPPSSPQAPWSVQLLAKAIDRVGAIVFIVCLTYLADHNRIPAMVVVYTGASLIGGTELLRMLTRIRLVGVGAASGGLGIMMMCLATPSLLLPVLSTIGMLVMGMRRLA